MKRLATALLIVTALALAACQPATVIVNPSANVPTPKWGAPIYVTATPEPEGPNFQVNGAYVDRFIDEEFENVCYVVWRPGSAVGVSCVPLPEGWRG